MLKYYQEKYNISLKKKNQPLLVAEQRKKRKEGQTIALPELMLMTGIPDDFDEFRRKKVSENTIKPPHDKKKDIMSLIDKMQSTAEQAALKGLGVDIKSKMTSFWGRHQKQND